MEADVAPSTLLAIIYTSGSTGKPKGVVHSHGNFLRSATKNSRCYGYIDERLFTQMPFFWVGGLTVCLLAAMVGRSTLVTCTSHAPGDILDMLEQERVGNVMAWPHIAQAIEAGPTFQSRDLSSVRAGTLLGALPDPVRPRDPSLMAMALGMTETAGPHTFAPPVELPEAKRGSFGPAHEGMSLRVVDPTTHALASEAEVGELWVRGDTLMVGMVGFEHHEVFEPDGWYRTGDLVSRLDGNYYFQGRLDDMIKTAGANVSPREVESVLVGLPGVSAAIVTGIPDPERGSVVGAVVIGDGSRELDPEEITALARAKLSGFKVPRVVVTLGPTDVPLMSSGKVDRRAMVARLGAAHRRP